MISEKYRPKTFGEIVGQEKTIATLRWYLDQPHGSGLAFLLTGPSGSGKTTLAYCAADYWGVSPHDCWKIESAECDIDRLRKLSSDMLYFGCGNEGRKLYVVDEIHTITGRAADRMLSLLEALPPHVLMIGTTTETDWTGHTLFSRWTRFDLQKPNSKVVAEHVERIARAEGLPIPDDPGWAEKMVKYSPCGLNLRDLLNQLPAYLLGKDQKAA